MRAYLTEFFETFDYPAEARTVLTAAYDRMIADKPCSDRFFSLIEAYEKNICLDYGAAIGEAAEISRASGVDPYTGQLLLFVCFSRHLRECYRERGLDDTIWKNSMLDLRYKAVECHLVYGVWGTFVAWWFDRFFNMTRFALGRLQFEIVPFGHEIEKNGVHLTPQSPVINVHIPRTGTPLVHESVTEAYAQAARFFAPQLGTAPTVFLCNTWLFFDKHREMLPPTSNILRFMDDYVIVQAGEYEDYSQLWRLFDCNYTGDPDALPSDTTLRRAYIARIKRGERTGWGTGIMIYQNNANTQ